MGHDGWLDGVRAELFLRATLPKMPHRLPFGRGVRVRGLVVARIRILSVTLGLPRLAAVREENGRPRRGSECSLQYGPIKHACLLCHQRQACAGLTAVAWQRLQGHGST